MRNILQPRSRLRIGPDFIEPPYMRLASDEPDVIRHPAAYDVEPQREVDADKGRDIPTGRLLAAAFGLAAVLMYVCRLMN